MKYEISQGQYRDFLNTLTYTQQVTRTANAPSSAARTGALISSGTARNGIKIKTAGTASTTPAVYGCDLSNNNTFDEATDGEWIACNYLSWEDITAYLDWAALRPMTELEYEKACRGTVTPFVNEYAWGDATATNVSSLLNTSQTTEASNTSGANLVSNNAFSGPVRVGIFATGSSTRTTAGSGYYGIMELSGNLWEQTVPVSNANARSFSNVMGDGTLASNGNADVSTWPATVDVGFRGGSYKSSGSLNYLSDRTNINSVVTTRNDNIGGRGVRKIVFVKKVEYLIVGGGGGGGKLGGGGGAGGYLTGNLGSLTAGAIAVTVGTGGAGSTSRGVRGENGTNSVFSSITAAGGGGGGSTSPNITGLNGGSGGGGGTVTGGTGGVASPSGQGNNGGNTGGNAIGGGGGGAGAVGQDGTFSTNLGGAGGAGLSNDISGTSVFYAGGGGGCGAGNAAGGNGGGGAGSNGNANATSGTANTGGGGGGSRDLGTLGGNGGNGGSGIVIIRYKTDGSDGVSNSSTGGTKTTSGAYTIHTFTSSGTFVCELSF